jgi:photosystem II stability/assembly factor-like uncharacterized protein
MRLRLPAIGVVLVVLSLCSCEDDSCPTCPPPESPAPDGWVAQTSPTQERLLRIDAIDATTVVAVGNSGTILRTSDGGSTWTAVTSGTTENFLAIFFVDGVTGWAAGLNNTLLKSTDAGLTWDPVSLSVPTDLRVIYFVDSQTGFTGGGPGQGQPGNQVFYTTSDGGDTWVPHDIDVSINGIAFVDADSGCVTGGGGVWKTTDGAQSWTFYECVPPELSVWLSDIVFVDSLQGWVSGAQGFLTHTIDGGRTWNQMDSGTTRTIPEIFFLDANRGWYVARPYGTIAATSDGGVTWRFQTCPTTVNLRDVNFCDENTGWVVGDDGTILKTTTGGF